MSNINSNALTKEQLFACLQYDGLELDADKISKAKNNDGEALVDIGFTYKSKQQDDSKAMAWYQLAINQNNSTAYNNLGFMYEYGYGVSQDHVTAMEYYLQAAKLNHRVAIFNIAILFLTGVDVPINKYKALEWFAKSGREADDVKKLNKQGIHLTEEDKNKTIHQLIHETYEIIRQDRIKREYQLKEENDELKEENDKIKERESKSSEENQELKELKASNEQEIQRLRNELQQQVLLLEQEKLKSGLSTQLISNLEQRLTDKTETINVYQTLVQAKNNEINLLKKDNQTRENTEKENLELKPKLEECQRCSQPLLDSIKSTNDDNTATTSPAKDNNAEFDNQTSLSGTRNGDIEKIKVKTETGLGNDSQLGYKKRKVSSNSS